MNERLPGIIRASEDDNDDCAEADGDIDLIINGVFFFSYACHLP